MLKEKQNVELCKQNSQEEDRLQDILLKRKENKQMVAKLYQDKEDSSKVNITFEDMDSGLRVNRDIEDILGRKVKDKYIGRQCDLEQITRVDHDEVLKWTIEKQNVEHENVSIRQQVIKERMPEGGNVSTKNWSKRNDRHNREKKNMGLVGQRR